MTNPPILKPCPFCGGEPIRHHYPAHTHKLATWMPDAVDQYSVECADCGVGQLCETLEAADTWWNLRHQQREISDNDAFDSWVYSYSHMFSPDAVHNYGHSESHGMWEDARKLKPVSVAVLTEAFQRVTHPQDLEIGIGYEAGIKAVLDAAGVKYVD